jgi:hypothetical protein
MTLRHVYFPASFRFPAPVLNAPVVLFTVSLHVYGSRTLNQKKCLLGVGFLSVCLPNQDLTRVRHFAFWPHTSRPFSGNVNKYPRAMIEKIYIIRHGEYVPKLSESPLFSCLDRIPAQLGHYQLVQRQHTICIHRHRFLTEFLIGRAQPVCRETHLSRHMEK